MTVTRTTRTAAKATQFLDLLAESGSISAAAQACNLPRRFNDIRRTIGGISQQMLTLTLKALVPLGPGKSANIPSIPTPDH